MLFDNIYLLLHILNFTNKHSKYFRYSKFASVCKQTLCIFKFRKQTFVFNNLFYSPTSSLSTACANWYSHCKAPIKKARGGRFCVLWVILAIVGNQRADKESKAEDFVYFVFLGNLVIKEKCPINLPFSKPFDQNLICGIGVGSILMQQNTPEKQNTPENIHQSQSTKYNGGLVWLVKDTLRQQRRIGHCQKNLTWKGAFI